MTFLHSPTNFCNLADYTPLWARFSTRRPPANPSRSSIVLLHGPHLDPCPFSALWFCSCCRRIQARIFGQLSPPSARKLPVFNVILKSNFAYLARYAERSERSGTQIGKSWRGFHVFTKGHLWGMEAGFQVGSLSSSPSRRSFKSSSDVSCTSWEQLYSLFSFSPQVPNACAAD